MNHKVLSAATHKEKGFETRTNGIVGATVGLQRAKTVPNSRTENCSTIGLL